jgi:hypothetical protein
MRNRFTLNTLWFKADIDAELEKLTKEGHIKIEEAGLPRLRCRRARAERASRLSKLAKELATFAMFRPGIQPGGFSPPIGASSGRPTLPPRQRRSPPASARR